MYWRWSCTGGGHVLEVVVMYWRWWSCTGGGHVLEVVMYWRWSCTGGGHVLEVVIYWRWSCTGGGHVPEVVMYRRWSCTGGGHILEVVMYWRWSCTGGGHVLEALMTSPYLTSTQCHISTISQHDLLARKFSQKSIWYGAIIKSQSLLRTSQRPPSSPFRTL